MKFKSKLPRKNRYWLKKLPWSIPYDDATTRATMMTATMTMPPTQTQPRARLHIYLPRYDYDWALACLYQALSCWSYFRQHKLERTTMSQRYYDWEGTSVWNHSQWKTTKEPLILQSQYRSCWWPGGTRGLGISCNGINKSKVIQYVTAIRSSAIHFFQTSTSKG